MDKQSYRDASASKNSLQGYMDAMYGKGAGYVDTYYNEGLNTLLVIKIQPEYATRNPKEGHIPVRHEVYNSKGRGFVLDLPVEYNEESKSELAKQYLNLFKEKYLSEYQVQAWSI